METLKEIPFKIFVYWKEDEKPEVRRFGLQRGTVENFFILIQKLLEVYPGLKDKNYTIAWKDEDGDDVIISTDMELKTALQFTNYENLKLHVYCKGENKKDDCIFVSATTVPGFSAGIPTGVPGGLHIGVVCDSCDNPVIGFRYKCTVCDDYDLCSQCEAAGFHPEHCMVRVPTATMPRTLIKAAIKRSRHFLKSVAGNVGEECPYMKRRRDKSGERRHRGHHGGSHGPHGSHSGPSGSHGPRGGEHARRNRVSWLDTFTTYMNEFANLAGDIDLSDDKPKAPETKPQEQKSQESAQQANKTTSESTEIPNQEPKQSTSNNAEAPTVPVINAESIKGLLQMFLQDLPLLNATTASQGNDVEMGQGDRKVPESDKVTETSDPSMKTATSMNSDSSARSEASVDSSINNFFYKDGSPEKVDDWTVINKEKDLIDVGAATPTEAGPTIGFNLPEEFQERVKINEGGSLYPPLNSSTAVLDPKVAEVRAEATPSAPEPEGAAAKEQPVTPKPTPQQRPLPRKRHPKPHIDAAIEQMLNMGFTNDGGWLTQLLESKDGNIAAVLDLLTPVSPKK